MHGVCLGCKRMKPITTLQRGRCPDCAHQREAERGTRTQRGYDNRWLRLVKTAIGLQPWCSYCGATTDLTGDHRVPLSRGGKAFTIEDVIVACRSCNSSRGNR